MEGMTETKVDAAVAAIERRDPSLGDWARVAADGLTAGEGAEILTQAGVQDFLWYRLPARYPNETWLPIARAAVALLGGAGSRSLRRDRRVGNGEDHPRCVGRGRHARCCPLPGSRRSFGRQVSGYRAAAAVTEQPRLPRAVD